MSNAKLFKNPPPGSSENHLGVGREAVRHADRHTLKRVIGETRGYRLHVLGIFVLNLLATPLALLTPVPLAIAIDSVLRDRPLPGFIDAFLPDFATSTDFRILLSAAALSVLIVLLSQLQWLTTYVLETYTGEQLTLRFRARLFRHVQRLSLAFHDQRGTADSIYRIQYDAPSIQWLLTGGVLPLVSAGTTLVAMIIVTARLDWQLAIVAIGIAPILYLSSKSYKYRMRSRYDEVRGIESQALGVVQEVLTGVRVVKAFGAEEREQERFLKQSAAGMKARVRLVIAESIFGLGINLVAALGTAAVLVIGVRGVQSGALTLGAFLVVMSYVVQLYTPLKEMSQLVASVQEALAGLRRSFELIDESPDVEDRPNARSVERVRGAIEFKDVCFSYDGRTRVLDGLSFSVPPGARLGIAGRTGAGKTTLVNLLSRFYDVQEGCILIDGEDVRDLRVVDLRRQFSIVLQEPVLFSTSIGENIAYARPEASQSDIEIAAKAANAHDFVLAMPDGYDTLVGERGMRLSGGERQRLSLARAFLKDAPILILDEPTSSVDIKTEGEIMEAMERLMLGRTTLMIAHRLGTLEYCDTRIELDHGRIVLSEDGGGPIIGLPEAPLTNLG